MHNEIGYIHHVGHVVHDIETARELYRRLGFLCSALAYPTLSRKAGEPAIPFGAAKTMPGETAPALPAFVAYAVAVRDLDAARRWPENNGFVVKAEPTDGIFVPARAALGAAIIFRQAR